jgi:hypothetical protein
VTFIDVPAAFSHRHAHAHRYEKRFYSRLASAQKALHDCDLGSLARDDVRSQAYRVGISTVFNLVGGHVDGTFVMVDHLVQEEDAAGMPTRVPVTTRQSPPVAEPAIGLADRSEAGSPQRQV